MYSGQGETVINILTDLNGFWTYENRELVLAENQSNTENNWPFVFYYHTSIDYMNSFVKQYITKLYITYECAFTNLLFPQFHTFCWTQEQFYRYWCLPMLIYRGDGSWDTVEAQLSNMVEVTGEASLATQTLLGWVQVMTYSDW